MLLLLAKFLLDNACKIISTLKLLKKKTLLVSVASLAFAAWAYSLHIEDPMKTTEAEDIFRNITSAILRECGPRKAILTMKVKIEPDHRGFYKARFASGIASKMEGGRYVEDDLLVKFPECYGVDRFLDFNSSKQAISAYSKPVTVSLRNNDAQDFSELDNYPEIKRMAQCTLWYKEREFEKLSYTSVLNQTGDLIWIIFVSKSIVSDSEHFCDLEGVAMQVRALIKNGTKPS